MDALTKKESHIIRQIFEPLTHIGHAVPPKKPLRSDIHFAKRPRKPLTFGLQDDCATCKLPDSKELVLSKDLLLEGVHFTGKEYPADIAKKALRVNLSDLVSGGATPYGYMLGLSLRSDHDISWLSKFSDGLRADQEHYHIPLIGGDLVKTTGPLGISITVLGLTDPGAYVTRDGAQLDDYIYISGTLGDATIGLSLALNMEGLGHEEAQENWPQDLSPGDVEYLIKRYHLPEPRVSITAEIAQFCTSAMDISDGLATDLNALCHSSSVGADVDLDKLPFSGPVQHLLNEGAKILEKIITGGDDYEILCTVPQNLAGHFENACLNKSTAVRHIGQVTEAGVRFLNPDGSELKLQNLGYDHF